MARLQCDIPDELDQKLRDLAGEDYKLKAFIKLVLESGLAALEKNRTDTQDQ